MSNEIIINKNVYGNYVIYGYKDERYLPKRIYMFYQKGEAIKKFRDEYGLRGKRCEITDYTKI